jgi:hypothetical protein
MSSVAVHMAQLNEFTFNDELAFVAVHELRRRAHGSVRDEFTINDELALSSCMSLVAVYMALYKVSSIN